MEMPKGYNEVSEMGEYTPIELGGHKLIILQIEEKKASNGSPYIKVSFDTDKDDKQPNYYGDAYKNDSRDTKKWGGWTNIFPTDKEGNTSRQFKTFCTSLEKSNTGFRIPWGKDFCFGLKGKKIGGVFREEEYINSNGDIKTARKLAWFRSIENVLDADIPAKREVDKPADNGTDFLSIPDGIENDLPFK